MTRKAAARATGIDIDLFPEEEAPFIKNFFTEDHGIILPVHCDRASERYKAIVEAIYQHRRMMAGDRQGWRCFSSGIICALECDHITTRSHGRNDRMCNLRMLSSEAHRRRHQSKDRLQIHPEVRRIARDKGWEWLDEEQQWKEI